MTEDELKIFINGALNFFKQATKEEAKIGSPYLMQNSHPQISDYTGVIAITGPQKGTVYFTAPKILLKHLLVSLGEDETSRENILDLVGEVANTISGNARSSFGQEFMISIPTKMEGTQNALTLQSGARSYVIPIYWKSYNAAVVVCIK